MFCKYLKAPTRSRRGPALMISATASKVALSALGVAPLDPFLPLTVGVKLPFYRDWLPQLAMSAPGDGKPLT
jgi:hypothetical protein